MSDAAVRRTLSLLSDFKALQEERVLQYKILNDAHKVYLRSGPKYDLESFEKVVVDVTNSFKSLSTAIIDLQKKAESDDCRDEMLANIIAKVQALESQKLHRTVDLQIATQQAMEHQEDELMQTNVKRSQEALNTITENINEALDDLRCYVAELNSGDL